jgi:hypothetical protein
MKSIIFIFINLLLAGNSFSQNVGIGTITPLARLHVTDSAVLFSAANVVPVTPGNPPLQGQGRRLMWYPDKAAFRVGYVSGTEWDKNNIGLYSFASGLGTTASGDLSTAMGGQTIASDYSATALGSYSQATGYISTAIGDGSNASGSSSFAVGHWSTASGNLSIAIGSANAHATNTQSIAIGNEVTASGIQSLAIGHNVTANGDYSIAMGSYVSTSGFNGCFTIGDNSTTTVMQTFVDNGYRARFAGGYRLFTNSAANIGALLNAGSNSWAALSDVRLKENFAAVDGELFLQKIATMPLTTWNYKTQDPKTFRHYGPMAQDFFAAFGKDEYGSIGCDTLINQQDFLGVNLIAIQALEKRTQIIEKLEKENAELKEMLLQLRKDMDDLKLKK